MTAPTLGVLMPALTPGTWAVVALVLVVLVAVTVVCVVRARRLDRLHRRTDAARAGLADALERRGTIALRVADALPVGDVALRASADTALAAVAAGLRTSDASEAAENALTRRLAGLDRDRLPPALAAELVNSEQLVVLARRVHNDAVRDTLSLRSRRLVRWLRLAGSAPVPGYFEIADPQPWPSSPALGDPAPDRPAATGPVAPG
jgi:hypothetical protein